LSLDLSRLLEASSVGACLRLDRVPISDAANALSDRFADGVTPVDHALADGEDFELILAVDPASAERFFQQHPEWQSRLTSIGHFIDQPGLWRLEDGALQPLTPRGYQHRLES
jgi:thiamine-monophosphate kinase